MGHIAGFAAVVLWLLPTALGADNEPNFNGIGIIDPIGARGYGDETCTRRALDHAGCQRFLPPPCVQEFASKAAQFCSSYLHLPATSTTTTSDVKVVTVTVTATATKQATLVETSTSRTVTTKTDTTTTPSTTTTGTTTVATSYIPPPVITVKKRWGPPGPRCPNLPTKVFDRLAPRDVSSLCSCFGVTPTTTLSTKTIRATSTTTATSTKTSTSTTTTTAVTVSVSTTTTTTTSTTTVQLQATATAIVDYCDITYNGGGVTPGNTVVRAPGDLGPRECCTLCWNTPNCVASATGLGFCQLLVKTSPLEGAPTSLQCPLGIENYEYLEGPGTLYRGPCSPGLN